MRFLGIVPLTALTILTACSEGRRSPTEPSPAPGASDPIVYTALGASDALGIGGSVECLPFVDCPNGTGYVQIIARSLRAGRSSFRLMNLGIPAAVLSRRIQDLGRSYGRDIPGNFLEHELPFVPPESNVLTVFAGGNDANAVGRAIDAGAAGSDVNAYIDDQVRRFGEEYRTLVSGIRGRAGNPRIVAANLPNFAGVPYTEGYTLERRRGIQTLSVRFSREGINALTSAGVTVVDLLCDSRAYASSFYSRDGYHPSDEGYAFIASRMMEAINAASYPAPQADCPQTRLVP
jgi:lysophospholipase L1-like esterase